MSKNISCFILIFLIFLSSVFAVSAEEQEACEPPTVTLDTPISTTPNSYVQVKVDVTNSTGIRMWHTKVELDVMSMPSSIRQYLEFDETEVNITEYKLDMGKKDYLNPDETESVTFLIKVTKEAPAMTIPIYVTISTEVGECEEGCSPFFQTYQSITQVIRSEPSLLLAMDTDAAQLEVGDCYIAKGSISRDYTISNTSQSTAFNVEAYIPAVSIPISISTTPQMPITSIKPESSVEGTFHITTGNLSVGTYSIPVVLTYEDYYNKEYTTSTSFNIVVTSTNYELFTEAELYFATCDYTRARERFAEARATYLSIENETMAQRCYEYINKIDGNTEFQTGQALYCDASFDDALEHFTQARLYYIEAGDCFGEDICDTVIDTCTFGDAATPASGDTQSENGGGGLSSLEIALIIIVIVLAGFVVLLLRN